MRALLLAAGFGTRLRPLTNHIPKCLVPIKGKPLLEIWIENLIESGVFPLLINTHYLSEEVEKYVSSCKNQQFLKTIFEKDLLGTAGTLIANIDFFQEEDGLLIHADNYCLADLKAFIEAHHRRPPHCLMTMMTFETDSPHSCGIVELDVNEVVVGFHEKVKNPPGNLANGAVYVLSRELIKELKGKSEVSDFSTEVLPTLVGRIYTWKTTSTFIDIGSPETYAVANNSH